jgi:hypothetical protein
MTLKTISTVALIIAATALLTAFALRVRPCGPAGPAGNCQGAAKGCCGSAAYQQNQIKGETK